MQAYYVPKEFLDTLANTTAQHMLYSADSTSYNYVQYQKYEEDLEFIFYVNGNRVWAVRFSSRNGD